MYKLMSNFYPAETRKNGYVGKAKLTIAEVIEVAGVSVFQKEDGAYDIKLPEWGDGKGYVVPHTPEARAAMLEVIAKSVEAENHFAFTPGKVALKLKDYEYKKKELIIESRSVNEKYADARYNLVIDGFCTLYGVTSQYRTFDQDGKKRGFVAVDMPIQRDEEGKAIKFTGADGKEHYARVFRPITFKSTDAEGKETVLDYEDKIVSAIRDEHHKLRKQSLDGQVADAKKQKAPAAKKAPAKSKKQDKEAR